MSGVRPDPAGTERPAAAEGAGRLAVLDLMRTVALLRVVAFHVTGIDPLTLIASMPVMFFVAGALFARSMNSRQWYLVVRDRYRRILPSLCVFAAALMLLYWSQGLLTSSLASVHDADGSVVKLGVYDSARLFFPLLNGGAPVGPGTPDDAIYWTWNPLWYVHTHLFLALIGPVLVWLHRRWPKRLLAGVALLWAVDALANQGLTNTNTFLVFFVAGFWFTDGRLLAVPQRTMRQAAIVCGVAGLAFFPFSPTMGINQWAPSLLLIGAMWVAFTIGWKVVAEKVATGPVFKPLIAFVNRRALSIYLWSIAGVYISRLVFPVEGNFLRLAGIAIVSLLLTTVVTLVACVLFGWIEDLAARRSPEWWPTSRRRAAA